MTNTELENNVSVKATITVYATFTVHRLNGKEEEFELDDFSGVKNIDGTTYIDFFTTHPDIATAGFPIKESVIEVKELVEFAREKRRQAYGKYKIVEK